MARQINLSGLLQTFVRSDFTPETKAYVLPLDTFKVASSMAALPAAADGTSLGLVAGAYGTAAPTLLGSDAGGLTITETCRRQYALPPEYTAGTPFNVCIRGAMSTTVSNSTATADVAIHKQDRDGSVGSDLCNTDAQSINSLTKTDKDFAIDGTGLAPGDVIDIQITAAVTDSGDAGVMKALITEVALKLSIKG